MRWILCGKNTAASECLDFLVGQGDEVWAIATRGDDGKDGWQRSFRAAAEAHGVPVDQPRRISDPEFVRNQLCQGLVHQGKTGLSFCPEPPCSFLHRQR